MAIIVECGMSSKNQKKVDSCLASLKSAAEAAFAASECDCGEAFVLPVTSLKQGYEKGFYKRTMGTGLGGFDKGEKKKNFFYLSDEHFEAVDVAVGAGKSLVSWPCAGLTKPCMGMSVKVKCIAELTCRYTSQGMFWAEAWTFDDSVYYKTHKLTFTIVAELKLEDRFWLEFSQRGSQGEMFDPRPGADGPVGGGAGGLRRPEIEETEFRRIVDVNRRSENQVPMR